MSRPHWKLQVVVIAVMLTVGAMLAWFAGPVHWLVGLGVVVASLFNGFVAMWEDDIPGGFNNPDGTNTPRYVPIVDRIARWSAGIFCWIVAAALVVGAVNAPIERVVTLAMGASVASIGLAAVSRRPLIRGLCVTFAFSVVAVAFLVAAAR